MKYLSTLVPNKLSLRKLFVSITLLLACSLAQAQNYDVINLRIDSLVNLGQPKSALIEAKKLDDLARKNKNAPQQIQAVLYRMTLQSYIEENALVGIIDSLDNDIAKSAYPVKPVLQSLLAGMYYNYYQQNRWQFNQRSKLNKASADFTQWDLQTIVTETSNLYKASLQQSKRLQATPIAVLDGVLKGDKATRYLRPSLYDLLLQRALQFFLLDEPALSKPKLAFSLNDARYFGSSQTFAGLDIKTTDTSSTFYIGLKLLQQASLFHSQQQNDEAMADLDIKRLTFLHNKTSLDNKDSLYVNSLKQIAKDFAAKPIGTDALVEAAKYYQQKDSLRSAIQYSQMAITQFPGSMGAHNADVMIKQINRRELLTSVEDVNMPGKPLLAQITYRNVKVAKYSVYHLSPQQKKQYDACWTTDASPYHTNYLYNKTSLLVWLKAFTNANKPVQQNELQLPGPRDYRSHHTEFKIDALPVGDYILWVEAAQPTDSILTAYANMKISRLAYTSRGTPDNGIELSVVDRESGQPLKGVWVDLFQGGNNWNAKLGKYVKKDTTVTGFTDAAGKFAPQGIVHGQTRFALAFKGDTLYNADNYISGANYNTSDDEDDDGDDKTVLFTDRQIYRPGQTVYFKGIELKVFKNRSIIVPDMNVEVNMKDNNGKVLSTQKLKSNDFGSFGGTFVIPTSILNGQVKIETEDGQINFRVEEYKRPTFKAEFLPVTQSYKLKDSIKVKGRVNAFSGYGLSQARVAYHIVRTVTPYNYRYGGPARNEIKTDTIKTNNQGTFEISFKEPAELLSNAKAIYRYTINADITDATGETHSANATVAVGDNNIAIQSYLPARVLVTDTGRVYARINNLNGQAQNGTIRVQVYALQNPPHLFKNRLWQAPDLFMMPRSTYQKDFADYAFNNEEAVKNWTQLERLKDTTLQVNTIKRSFFKLQGLEKQPSGMYKIVLSALNEKGDTTSVTDYFDLVNKPTKPAFMANWVVPVNKTVQPGAKAEFLVGIDEPINVLIEKLKGSKIESSQWLHINKGQQSVKIPIAKTDSGIINVQFTMIYHNRIYNSYNRVEIARPDKSLDVKMITFRDKLQPGDKEQWKLQITAKNDEKLAAEMVAGMYDASLDDIAGPAYWGLTVDNRYRNENYFAWNSYNFVQQQNTTPLKEIRYVYQEQNHIYEELNLFGYNYYGGYNAAYHQYLYGIKSRSTVLQRDQELAETAKKNAALVKNGIDVTGTVVDEKGQQLPGVTVSVKYYNVSISTNSQGYFKIRVPVKGALMFRYIGYDHKEVIINEAGSIKVVLKLTNAALQEVVVIGYGSVKKSDLTGAVSSVMLKAENLQATSIDQILQGRVAGVSVVNGAPGGEAKVMIRGSNSISYDKAPLYIVDGIIVTDALSYVAVNDIEGISVLKDASATAIYGAKGANGVIIITTKSGKAKLLGGKNIVIRKNFNETAFFYPQLRTNDKGEILIDFTIPEALTRWKFRGFAHTRDLRTGYIETEVVTQKQLSIGANTPRFLREGDTLTVSARLTNQGNAPIKGKVNLQLFNGVNMQPVSLLVNSTEAQQNFDVAPSTNKAVSFKIAIPAGLDALTYRLTADGGQFSDGEENTLPVLPNRMLVTESLPMMVRSGQTKTFNFDKLITNKSTTLKSKTLTLEYTQNPAWYAVQALPYMMEFPYECSEQIFSRYYANSMATNLVNKMPVIKRVFDQWKATNSAELTSNLEKNPELKATLLEETPWLRNAVSESEQKKRIALLFDLNGMRSELDINLNKLKERQLSDGGFPWFGGDRSDAYITRHVLAGIGQLYHLGIADLNNETLKAIADKAMVYLDNNLITSAEWAKRHKVYDNRFVSDEEIHGYYTQSYFTSRSLSSEMKQLTDNYLKRAEQDWMRVGLYEQALIALTMQRNGKPEVAKAIIRSLNETAQHSDDMGMYWSKNQLGYFWYQSPVETQSLLIELFTESGGNEKAVEEMKIWLLRSKQTTNWKTTKATAAACYALLLQGNDWLADNGTSEIKLGGKNLYELKPDIKAEAGTGYIKTNWTDEAVKPALGNIRIANNSKTISWGAMHWQYLENLDRITPSNTDIRLERKYFIKKQTDAGVVLTAVDATHQPKTGDVLKVVVYLKAGRDFEYVQLKDMRPSGTEPVDALSTYKYQDGLYYYQVTKDVATNFFISYLSKGNYVFEYSLRVVQPGNFSTGISTVQCMYAPEFNAHSQGARMTIK